MPRPRSTTPCCGACADPAAARLVMVYSASIAIAEGGLHRPPAGLFPGPPRRLPVHRPGRRRGHLPGAAAPGSRLRALAVHRRRGAAGAGADSRHRPRRQWRPPLDLARASQPAAVRTDEAVRRALCRRLHGAQDGRDARPEAGLPADGRAMVLVGMSCCSRSRTSAPSSSSSRSPWASSSSAASRLAVRAADRGCWRLRDHDHRLALPARPHLRLHGPVGRCLSAGLPAVALADRLRPRRTGSASGSAPASKSCSTCRKRTPTSCSR
jgi:hypothetical protein